MSSITIDFSKPVGRMKPMHGMNAGSVTKYFTCDAREIFKEAGIPITRLHDAEYPYGRGEFVDIPCVFKNFDADVDDPASYNFQFTDEYLNYIDECGTKILYRLGVSIEHHLTKRYIYPPKDYKKWAQICEHIIRHYNEGWADGYHLGIDYWEIWTEPDLCLDNHPENPTLWYGTMREFAHFYTVAATYLKECFPNLKIGGPAMTRPKTRFSEDFFDELTKDGAHPPMDFFSWHGYISSVEDAVRKSRDADEMLAKYGYSDAESVFDEWNYVKSWSEMNYNADFIRSYKGAAFDAAVMARLQSENCDMMNYYSAEGQFIGIWNGLFTPDNSAERKNGQGSPMKRLTPFYAFKAFNEVYKNNTQIQLESDDERLYGIGAFENGKGAFYVSSFVPAGEELEEKEVHFELSGLKGKTITLSILDENHDMTKLLTMEAKSFNFVMPPFSVLFAEIR